MCDTWSDEQWLAASNETEPDYTLVTTRYNAQGEVARVYREDDGWHWGVLPGRGNYAKFIPETAVTYGTTAEAAALAYLERAGYALTEQPTEDSVAV